MRIAKIKRGCPGWSTSGFLAETEAFLAERPPAQLYDPNSVRPQKMLLYIIYDDLFKGVPGGRNVRSSVSPIAIRGLASLIACMYVRTDALAKMLFYLIYGEAI